jgi:O-antigen/teichoic acid export membrane protein
MIKNIFANFLGKIWSVLSNFLFIPLYIKFLGFESYSIISFSLVISSIMFILDSGLTATLSRELARSDNSLNDKIRTFKTLESLYLILSVTSILIIFLFSEVISNSLIKSDSYKSKEIAYFIKIISFDIGLQLLNRFYLGGFVGLEQQIKSNLLQVAWGIFRNGLVVFALILLPSLEVFFIWQTSSTIFFAFLSCFLLRLEFVGTIAYFFSKIEYVVFKSIWKFAGGMLLISLVSVFNTQIDKLLISRFLPIESLGYYTMSVTLSMGILIVVNPISVAMLPKFTSYFTRGEIFEAKLLFSRSFKVVCILVFSILAQMIFFSKQLLWIWTGDLVLANNASKLLPILSTSYSFLALSVIPYSIAIANGYTKLNNFLGLLSLIITLPGYWFATSWFGALGAAVVFCFVQISITLFYLYFINRKFFNDIIFIRFFLGNIIKPICIVFIISYMFFFISSLFEFNRFTSFCMIAISTIMTFSLTAIVVYSKSERSVFLAYFKSKNYL